MGEQPVAVAPETPTAAPQLARRRLRSAGILVIASAVIGVGLVLWILSVKTFEPMFLYALCPWLFVVMFIRDLYAILVIPLIFGVSLVAVGILVVRGRRDALITAIALLVVEAVPSVLIAVASGASFAIPAVPRVAVILYLASVLRATNPLGPRVAPVAPAATRPTGAPKPAGAIVGWGLAVIGGLSVGLAYRAAQSLSELAFYKASDQFEWWLPMRWPAAVLAFALGVFAASRMSAILRATLALVLAALVPLSGAVSTADILTTVVTSALFGGTMGWLGHVARGRTLLSVVAALCLPAFMALEMVRRPGGFLPSVGSWSVLAAAALLAVAFLVRVVIKAIRRPRRPGRLTPTERPAPCSRRPASSKR